MNLLALKLAVLFDCNDLITTGNAKRRKNPLKIIL